ncbi:MAG: flagellar hook-basal body protein [Candidatus Marinimicrobia bacterium]|nr:flagellar hook-basal body protein [Candidatus Neomarinimicrobiota bacterium]
MDFNFFKIAQSMIRNQLGTDIVANNLSNIGTTGFKRDDQFTDWLIEAMQVGGARSYTDFSRGEVKRTDNPLDFSLAERGFFVLQTPDGQIYTRSGHFTVDSDGFLMAQNGAQLLGEHGPISILGKKGVPGTVEVTRDGMLFVGGEEIDRLLIAAVPDLQALEKVGGNTFRASEGQLIMQLEPEAIHVQQGVLEGSNVAPVEEMIRLIELQRNYESTQRIARAMDSVEGRAISLSDYR